MKTSCSLIALIVVVAAMVVWGRPQLGNSQVPAAKSGDRFEFDVVESFDARYEGDTPGHMGRSGGLGEIHPQVALGDTVYRGDEAVGVVTGLKWSRVQGSLDVEFDPTSKVRIAVGEIVWLKIGGSGK